MVKQIMPCQYLAAFDSLSIDTEVWICFPFAYEKRFCMTQVTE